MALLTYSRAHTHRESPRLWLENHRLHQLGFSARTPIQISNLTSEPGILLTPARERSAHKVSGRYVALIPCPIIDINSAKVLAPLAGFEEYKIQVTVNQIKVTPSQRAFHIRQHSEARIWPVLELAAGGGTMSEAIQSDPRFALQYAVEMDKRYSSCWAKNHPNLGQTLVHADMRNVEPSDIPPMAWIHASLPCTCFSTQGVAQKGLKGKSELGDSGDLFIDYLRFVRHHMPLLTTVENVPGFFTSLAGQCLVSSLQKIGYKVTVINLLPLQEWAEPQSRNRGFMVATLHHTFVPSIPMLPFAGTAGDYLDAPDAVQDKVDANAIAASIRGRVLHQERHAAKGNRFGFTTINPASLKVPTLLRSYYKVNAGPFVETAHGLRLLRSREAARLMGCSEEKFSQFNYSTNIQLLGQGVQTRLFAQLVRQLGNFMTQHYANPNPATN